MTPENDWRSKYTFLIYILSHFRLFDPPFCKSWLVIGYKCRFPIYGKDAMMDNMEGVNRPILPINKTMGDVDMPRRRCSHDWSLKENTRDSTKLYFDWVYFIKTLQK